MTKMMTMEKNQASYTENRENKSKKEEIKNNAELFGVDKDDIDMEKDFTYIVQIPKDTKDNILRISRMVKVAVLKISGYEEDSQSDGKSTKFRLIKQPFASSEVIKAFETHLSAYADESNIITKQEWEPFREQALADWRSFYKFCMRNKAQSSEHLRTVYRAFQGCIIRIGEITCDNPKNMDHLFGSLNNEEDKYREENPFK